MLKGICVFSKNIKKAVEAGFDYVVLPGVEIAKMTDDEFNLLLKTINENNITVSGYNAYCNGETPIVGDGFSPEKTRDYAKLMCLRGQALGIKNIGIGGPFARKLPEDYDMDKAFEQGAEFIKITAQEAEKYGFNVLAEGLSRYCCDFVHFLHEAYRLMKKADMPNVKMVADFYHMKLNGELPTRAYTFLPNCLDVHISGCDNEMKRPFVGYSDKKELETISKVLKTEGYDISVTLEPDDTDIDFEKKAKEAFDVMDSVF